MSENLSFMQKHEFLIRRIHSLAGLIPVGLYMMVHLATNSTILNGVESFQDKVYMIHGIGNLLVVVEWLFIFLPLLFHAILGMVFAFGGKSNYSRYPTGSNLRYVLQRATGMIAFVFIFGHVLHLHGWFHVGPWIDFLNTIGLAEFKPYNAASTTAKAMQSGPIVPVFYIIGLAACVFHFANGIWTMGITWGVWTTPAAQQRANYLAAGIGIVIMVIGLSAIFGFYGLDQGKAKDIEDRMYNASVESGRILPNQHKRSGSHDEETESTQKSH